MTRPVKTRAGDDDAGKRELDARESRDRESCDGGTGDRRSGDPSSADGRRDRWGAHRRERRQEFVAAALRVLAASGPDLPMDAVAAEAGVTKPVLYRYFTDKAALVEALGDESFKQLRDRLLPAMQSPSPPVARIRDAVGAYFALIDEQPNLYWLLARWPPAEGTRGEGPVHRDREFVSTALAAILGDALLVFGLDSGGAEPWAYGITGLVQSTGEWWLQRRSMSRVRVVEYVTELIWAALSGVLRELGVDLDPGEPLPPLRPGLSVRSARNTQQRASGERRVDGGGS